MANQMANQMANLAHCLHMHFLLRIAVDPDLVLWMKENTITLDSAMRCFTVLLFSARVKISSKDRNRAFFYANILCAFSNNMLAFFRIFMDYPGMFVNEHHFDAIYNVLIEKYMDPMEPMQSQTFKQFLIAAMVHVMIKKTQMFPPHKRDAYVTFFPDPIMMSSIYSILERKQVFFSDTVLLKRHNKSPISLDNLFRSINSEPNKTHIDAISKILELKPDFFQKWQTSILEYLHSGNDVLLSANGEKKWIESMQTGCPEFLAEMQSFRVEDNTIRWIFFYTIQWDLFNEYPTFQCLDALMKHLISECPMPFPFMSPPKIFTKDYQGKRSGNREVGADPKKWGQISVSDLKKIFFGMRGINGDDIFLHEHKGIIKPQIKHLSSLLCASRMRKNAMGLYAFQLKYAKALPVIQEGMRKRFAYNIQRKSASILILLAIKRRSDMGKIRILKAMADIVRFGKIPFAIKRRSDMRILKAMADIVRFGKIPFANHVQRRLKKFIEEQACYECPTCFEDFNAVKVVLIQPCGHILCNSCFQAVKLKCPCCRLIYKRNSCKGVIGYLSKPGSPVYFTTESPEKKSAISVIGWAMKRRLVARI
jgi:hypothetical protein